MHHPFEGADRAERLALARQQIADNIERVGWHVTAVFPTDDGNLKFYFAYTVGLWTIGHPELIVFGLQPETAHAIFATAYERISQGNHFHDGDLVTDLVQNGFPIYFRTVPNDDPDYPLGTATDYYGHRNYKVLQLVLSDTQKRLPWEPNYETQWRQSQEALGPVSPPS